MSLRWGILINRREQYDDDQLQLRFTDLNEQLESIDMSTEKK